MENKEFFSIFPMLGYEVFGEKIEKPLELNLHANSVVSINALNTVIANAIEKSKLGEAGFVIRITPVILEFCPDLSQRVKPIDKSSNNAKNVT
jgi:hypothetical protein